MLTIHNPQHTQRIHASKLRSITENAPPVSPMEAVLDDTAAMRQAMAQALDDEDDRVELVEDAVLVEAADANGADGVEEGVPPEEPWHSGIVERKSERSAEVRLVGGTLKIGRAHV